MAGAIPAGDPAGKQQVEDPHHQQGGNRNQRMGKVNVVRRFRFVFQIRAVTFIVIERFPPLALQPEQAKADNKQRANQPQPGGSPGISAEEAGGDNILDLRRAGQGVHGERERPQRHGRRDQPFGDPALAKQFGGERINGKRHHKERHAAVG